MKTHAGIAEDVAFALASPFGGEVLRVTAAALRWSRAGLARLPREAWHRLAHGGTMTAGERKLVREPGPLGAELLAGLPGMEEVADAVAFQNRGYDGSGPPANGPVGHDIPLPARIVKLVLDVEDFVLSGFTTAEALAAVEQRRRLYDPLLLYRLRGLLIDGAIPLTDFPRAPAFSPVSRGTLLDEVIGGTTIERHPSFSAEPGQQ